MCFIVWTLNIRRYRKPTKRKAANAKGKSNRASAFETYDSNAVASNGDRMKASRMAQNNMYTIGGLFSIANDDVNYVERQFAYLDKLMKEYEKKLVYGYNVR